MNDIKAVISNSTTTPPPITQPRGDPVIGIVGVAVVGFFYFLPTIIAAARRHRNWGAVFALNFLLGWTLIGWVISLVWALTSAQQPQTIVVHAPYPPQPAPPADTAS